MNIAEFFACGSVQLQALSMALCEALLRKRYGALEQ